MLSKINQSWKDRYCMFPCKCGAQEKNPKWRKRIKKEGDWEGSKRGYYVCTLPLSYMPRPLNFTFDKT